MATEIDFVSSDGGDGASGVDRGIALDENHSGHVASDELLVVGLRRGGAALRRDETIILDLRGELLEGRGLEAGEDERGGNRFERGTRGQTGTEGGVIGQR